MMHDLFLGTGKHTMEVWLEYKHNGVKLLTQQLIKKIDDINNFIVPDGMGRLPRRLTSHFGSFTADQWKNWIIIYSAILLFDVLVDEHFQCWLYFVAACKCLCRRIVRNGDIAEVKTFLHQFCTNFCDLYGEKACTMNMHLHLHLCESILDFGPTYAFWLYAFERYNGILGSYHTNNLNIECQIMRKFLESQSNMNYGISQNDVFTEDFLSVLGKNFNINSPNASISPANVIELLELPCGPVAVSISTVRSFNSIIKPVGSFKEKVFPDLHFKQLSNVVDKIFSGESGYRVIKSKFYLKFGKILISDDLIGSAMPNCNVASSMIIASWPALLEHTMSDVDICVGEVQYFVQITVTVDVDSTVQDNESEDSISMYFAYVHWRKSQIQPANFPKDIAIICETIACPSSHWCFLPLH